MQHPKPSGIKLCRSASTGIAGQSPFDRSTQYLTIKNRSVHARGTFLGSKYATIQFLSQDLDSQGERGTIINISSVAGGLVGVFECCE